MALNVGRSVYMYTYVNESQIHDKHHAYPWGES